MVTLLFQSEVCFHDGVTLTVRLQVIFPCRLNQVESVKVLELVFQAEIKKKKFLKSPMCRVRCSSF